MCWTFPTGHFGSFEDEFRLGIYDDKYSHEGGEANRLRALIEAEDEYTVCRVLRRLWEYAETLSNIVENESFDANRKRLFELLSTDRRGRRGSTDGCN